MRSSSFLLPIAAAGFIAACNSDSALRSDNLTRDEAIALMRATSSQIDVVAESRIAGPSAAIATGPGQLAAAVLTQTFRESIPCENGRGQVAVDGTLTVTGDANAPTGLELSATMTPARCAVVTETGDAYEITGDPNLAVHVSLAFGDGDSLDIGSMTETVRGGFTWLSGSRSGRCSVNLTQELDVALNRVRTRGTFCGLDVDEVETL